VTIYNTEELDAPPGEILVEGMEEPKDLVICSSNGLLFIADNPRHSDTCSRLWIVGLSSKERPVKSVEFSFKIESLAITSLGLLVVPTGVKDGRMRVVKIESSRDVSAEQDFETTIVKFEMCESSDGRLSQFMANGELHHVHCFGDARMRAVLHHNGIWLLDGHAWRILVFNLQEKLEFMISLEHGKNNGRPRKLCFDEKPGRIYVGTGSHDRVGIVVYDVAWHL
jgi:hypothetical protein